MRKIHLVGLLLLTVYGAMFSGATGRADEDDWKFVRQDQGVAIYLRPLKDSKIPELRGHTRFHASISDVYRVISDYDHFSDFIPMVSESRVRKRIADNSE